MANEITATNLKVSYKSDFLSKEKADKIYRILERSLVYNTEEESKVVVFGKEHSIPRKQVAYGDEGTFYKFAGSTVYAKSWHDNNNVCRILRNIKKQVEEFTGEEFNFVLINRYKDGHDCIGHHQDDERELGDKPTIVGVSLGVQRPIIFKPYKFLADNITLDLEHGSIFVMHHPTNDHWTHSIPKREKIKTPRISLTFRKLYL